MAPRNLSARIVLILCALTVSVLSIHFSDNAAATQTHLFGYCYSTPDQATIYFTQVFDLGSDLNITNDPYSIQNEYSEYLKGRFDFKANANYPVACQMLANMSQAQSMRRDYETQMRQEHKQIVQVEWTYRLPGHAISSVPWQAHTIRPVNTAQADHTFCISDLYEDTVYFTGPVATPPPVTMSSWINGFTQFLKGKYSYRGQVYCNMGTAESARRLVSAHLEGSRAAGRKVVDTSWKYDASQATNTSPSRPAEQDDDRVPAQRPAAQPPSLQARDFALKEGPHALQYCVHDRVMAAAFECDCLRRQIWTYRLNHVSDTLSASPTPLEDLFKGDKVNFKSCIQADWKFKMSVRSAVRLQGASAANADCAIEKFRSLLEAKPYPSQSKEILNEAIGACR